MEAIWEFIQGYLTAGNLIGLLVIILGLVAAKTGLDFINDIRDVITSYRDAKHKDSPGGDRITDEERAAIEAEAAEAVSAIWDNYKGTIFDWLGRTWKWMAFWK